MSVSIYSSLSLINHFLYCVGFDSFILYLVDYGWWWVVLGNLSSFSSYFRFEINFCLWSILLSFSKFHEESGFPQPF